MPEWFQWRLLENLSTRWCMKQLRPSVPQGMLPELWLQSFLEATAGKTNYSVRRRFQYRPVCLDLAPIASYQIWSRNEDTYGSRWIALFCRCGGCCPRACLAYP